MLSIWSPLPCNRFGNNSFVKTDRFLCSLFLHSYSANKFQRTSGCCVYKILRDKPTISLSCCHNPRHPSCYSKEQVPWHPGAWAWRTLQTPYSFPPSYLSLGGIRDTPGKRELASSYRMISLGVRRRNTQTQPSGRRIFLMRSRNAGTTHSLLGHGAKSPWQHGKPSEAPG